MQPEFTLENPGVARAYLDAADRRHLAQQLKSLIRQQAKRNQQTETEVRLELIARLGWEDDTETGLTRLSNLLEMREAGSVATFQYLAGKLGHHVTTVLQPLDDHEAVALAQRHNAQGGQR